METGKMDRVPRPRAGSVTEQGSNPGVLARELTWVLWSLF